MHFINGQSRNGCGARRIREDEFPMKMCPGCLKTREIDFAFGVFNVESFV